MRFSELEGKTVGVWGLGRETRAFAVQLAAKLTDAHVSVLVREDPREDAGDPCWGAASVVGLEDALEQLSRCDVLIRSPGVSVHKLALVELARRGVPITTATGLWLAERAGVRVIGVTGTKGKSTTATLIAHLSNLERTTHLAGNIGLPAIDLLDTSDEEWVVLELSSYQIADLPAGPQIAVITNLFKEHVDWHGSEQAYRREKLRLFALPGVEAAVYPTGDPDIEEATSRCPRRVAFGGSGGWHVVPDGVRLGDGELVSTTHLPLRGRHNAENLCAALAALDAAGLALPRLPVSLEGVRALPHRLQTVHESDGVEWVDDSISTTPESSIAALDAFADRKVILIAGGQDRGQDHQLLASIVAARRVVLVTLPDTGARFAADARRAGIDGDRIVEAGDLHHAVEAARRLAVPGTVVLLSPAASSYHRYRNFEERGEHFAALAKVRGPVVK